MDRLSVIPEVFFDMIARFAPGTVFLTGLTLAVPDARRVVIGGLRDPANLPPMSLFIPLAVICAWAAGFLLSVASHPIEILYSRGVHAIWYQMGDTLSRKKYLFCAIEFCLGLPVMLFARKRFMYYQLDGSTQAQVKDKIKRVFHCDHTEMPFWLCVDYVRTYAPGPAASAVVKSLAEATCARSLTLGFLIIGFTTWRYTSLVASIPAFALATIASAGFSYYRGQVGHRMLLSLLLAPVQQEVDGA